MSDSVGKIDLDLGINYAGFKKELNGISNTAGNTAANAFSKLGKAATLAFSTAALVSFGKASIKLASDLQEVANVVNVTFRDSAMEIENFAKQAITSFGMGELSAKKFASSFGASLKSMGFADRQFTNMSKELTKLTGDMASFYNLDHEEAFNKLRAGVLSGEAEPLKVLGAGFTVAGLEAFAMSKGIKKSYEAMSEAEKVMLRYEYILSRTKDAQGDFARTSNSWANQTRVLQEQFKTFQSTLGAGFINALTPVLGMINALIAKLQTAAEYFRAFTAAIFGEQAQSGTSVVANVAEELNNAADGAKNAGKAAKASKNSLSNFDELNIIGKDASTDASTLSPIVPSITAGLNPDEQKAKQDAIKTQMDSFVGDIKKSLDEVSIYISKNFGPAIGSMENIFNQFKLTGAKVFGDLKTAVIPVLDWFVNNAPSMFSSFVNSSSLYLSKIIDVAKTIFDSIWGIAIAPGLNVASAMLVDLLNVMKGAWDQHGTDILSGILSMVDGIKIIFETAWSYVGPVITNLLKEMKWLWDKHFKGLVDAVVELVFTLAKSFFEIQNKIILPFMNWLLKVFGPTFERAFKLAIGIAGTLLATVTDVTTGIVKVLSGITKFITGVFTGNWGKAWEGVVQVFSGIFGGLAGIVKGIFNSVIDLVNHLIETINDVSIDVPDWVPGVGGKSLGFNVPRVPKLAKGGLVSAPTLAMVGDNKGANVDPEVVSPLSKLQQIIGGNNQPMIEVLLMILDAIENQDRAVYIDGEKMSKTVKQHLDIETKRQGTKLITL